MRGGGTRRARRWSSSRGVAIEPSELGPEEQVRVRFTDKAALRLAQDFGRIAREVDARVQPLLADSLEISIWVGRDFQGTPFSNVRQTFSVGRAEVVDVSRREVDVGRSALMGIGAGVGFYLIVRALTQSRDPNPPRRRVYSAPPGAEPQGSRAPFHFAVPLGGAR